MRKKIAFLGWWTWGHVFPIKAMIEYMNKNSNISPVYWFGERNSLESRQAKETDNTIFIPMISWKLRREKDIISLVKNFFDFFRILYGFFKSIVLLLKYNIDVVFCKWWYVALPVLFAAWVLRKEIYVHESDTVPWLVNKLAAKMTSNVFLGFPWSIKNWELVWQLLSDDIINFKKEEIDITLSNLSNNTNIIVMWGSQGSYFLYKNILELLESWKLDNYNFFVVLGSENKNLRKKFEKFDNVGCYEFLNQKQIWYLYNICDIGITRGGATSLAEQKIFGLKLIIVPLPYTGGNHQYYNALYYQKEFDDILISQDNNFSVNLLEILNKLDWFKKNSESQQKDKIQDWIKNVVSRLFEENNLKKS